MLLSEAIDKFTNWRMFKVTGHTVVRYDRPLRTFCLCMRNKEVEDVTIEDITNHLKMMTELGWQRNGISVVCLAFRKFFEFLNLQDMNVINENLIPLPRKEYNIPRVCAEADYRKLVAAIDNHHTLKELRSPYNIRNHALLALTHDTGARIGEILSLDVDDLDLKSNSMKALIKTEKSRGRRPIREIFWTRKTNEKLKKWIKTREHLMKLYAFADKDALFISIARCPNAKTRGYRLSGKSATELFRRLSNRAGLKVNVNPHSLRHAFGRDIIMSNGSSSDVTNLLGHSHTGSSYIYTMMFGPQLEKRYRKFRGK